MGYNETLFELQPISDEFKCSICTEVLQDPQTASHCEHIFCLACIQQCFQTNNNNNNVNRANCPVCRQPINSSDLKPTIRSFRNLLEKLRVRCQFELCTEVVELQHFEQHRMNCDQNPDNQHKFCSKRCVANIVQENQCSANQHNCVTFLQSQIHALKNDNSQQKSAIEKLTSEMDRMRQEIQQLQTNESNETRDLVSKSEPIRPYFLFGLLAHSLRPILTHTIRPILTHSLRRFIEKTRSKS